MAPVTPPVRIPTRLDRYLINEIRNQRVRVCDPHGTVIREAIAVTEVLWRDMQGHNWPLTELAPIEADPDTGAQFVGVTDETDYWAWKLTATPLPITYYPTRLVWIDIPSDPSRLVWIDIESDTD